MQEIRVCRKLFLTFNILKIIKAYTKVMIIDLYTNNQIYCLQFVRAGFKINRIFFIQNQSVLGLLKVIGIQM